MLVMVVFLVGCSGDPLRFHWAVGDDIPHVQQPKLGHCASNASEVCDLPAEGGSTCHLVSSSLKTGESALMSMRK